MSFIVGQDLPDSEKLSAYECGFNPFEDSRKTFDIKFYIIAMVFIVFDVEVALLIPLIFTSFSLPISGAVVVFFFLFILILGFMYEWAKEILNWA
jgi:NADH-quinone oxidoreductase subunit A